ncbi:hypothetical protein SAMN05444483_10341 [Salegentibacter echinorum]|uniref:Uncharacterized protein n=1 Tax=Salegentibacter echinorum TaxID=1073325 RepID=A0A1M5F657_SALEC|nr:hypothetical protein [Salegentibacter echinorum]SHF86955.1 hypothetical protein SAMN05444483_10341 [Salegentibacter echinorum]
MKKTLKYGIYLVIFFTISLAYSQDTIVKRYISLSYYKKSGKPITQKDSANFRYHNGDTLVPVSADFEIPQGKNKVKVPYEEKDSTFLELYKNVVYGTDQSPKDPMFMRYWKDSVKVYFEPSVPGSQANELMEFGNKISKNIDSLNIKRVFTIDDSNYRIYYLNSEYNTDFEPRIVNKSGYYVHWNGKNQIYKTDLKINTSQTDNDNYIFELLKFQFFRSLGYFRSSKKLDCRSYLSACRVPRQLTDIDLELLKYHYSYGVCKGVNLEDFEELHNKFSKLRKKHENVILEVVHSN